jgi:hypothetical protein
MAGRRVARRRKSFFRSGFLILGELKFFVSCETGFVAMGVLGRRDARRLVGEGEARRGYDGRGC